MEDSPLIVVVAGVVCRGESVLLAQRKRGAHLELLWEFPGGKLEEGEGPEQCLAREMKEELGVEVEVGPLMDVLTHRYPERRVLICFYECRLSSGEPRAVECEAVAWVKRSEMLSLRWVPADGPFVRRLASGAEEL
jgi:mutator protein MutT